jgi:hypothetical protein
VKKQSFEQLPFSDRMEKGKGFFEIPIQ